MKKLLTTNAPLLKALLDGPVEEGWGHYATSAERARGVEGLFLEFGVYQGTSINIIADQVTPRIVHGFDSFKGLPEDWWHSRKHVLRKGRFTTNGKLPEVRPNVRLHVGLFADTLPGFLQNHAGQCAFVHLDADIYSSTIQVLNLLNERIMAGTYLRFDELCPWTRIDDRGYEPFLKHEYRALTEWCANHQREVEPIDRNDREGALVRVVR